MRAYTRLSILLVVALVGASCAASDDSAASSTSAPTSTAPTTIAPTTATSTTTTEAIAATTTTEPPTTTTEAEVAFEYPYDFELIDGVTVLEPSEWDAAWTAVPNVYVEDDDTWWMFYSGSGGRRRPTGLGLASSPDGLEWEKLSTDGPFFSRADGQPFGWVFVHPDGQEWVMYYTLGFSVGYRDVYRATAPAPDGPWKEGEVAFSAPGDSWNQRIIPSGLTKIGDTWWVPYGGFGAGSGRPQIGFMTSADGVDWVSSESVYSGTGTGWDELGVMPANIVETDNGLELFYIGFDRTPLLNNDPTATTFKMGRLVSTDGGESWLPDNEGQPILDTGERGWPGVGVIEQGGTYFVYGGHELGSEGIFLTVGTIP